MMRLIRPGIPIIAVGVSFGNFDWPGRLSARESSALPSDIFCSADQFISQAPGLVL